MGLYLDTISMDSKIIFWLGAGFFSVLAAIAGFSSKAWFTTLINELRDIKKELKQMNETLIVNTQDIKYLKEKTEDHAVRLEINEKRINKIHDELIYKK